MMVDTVRYANLRSKFLLSDILSESSEDLTHCDVTIKIGSETIPAHSPVLAAASTFFRQLLSGVNENDENYLLVMAGFEAKEVHTYLSSIYKQNINFGNNEKTPKYFDLEEYVKVEHQNPEEKETVDKTKKETDSSKYTDDDDIMDLFGNYSVDDEGYDMLNEEIGDEIKYLKQDTDLKHTEHSTINTDKRKKRNKTKFPFDCHHCGKEIIDRKFKLRHPCFKKTKERMDLRISNDLEGEISLLDSGKMEDLLKEEKFICHMCGINFPAKSALTTHVKMKCGNVCEICKEIFASKTEVKAHMFRVHQMVTKMRDMDNTKLPEECPECGKRYSNKTVLGLHIKATHTKEGLEKVQCNDCGKFFSNKGALKKHSSLHRPPELPCPICGKLFHNNQYLLRHAMSAHGANSDKKHKCEICNKGFDTLTTLEGHRNWHLNLKPFRCRWCERTYQNQPNASAHERKRHTVEYNALLTVQHRKIAVFSNT